MKRNKKRIVAAIAVIGALAAGGAAFTASNTVPGSIAGYGTSTISGATATSIHYVLNAAGDQITGVNLVFSDDLTANGTGTVKAGFNGGAATDCTVGSYTAGTGTSVTCTGFSQSTSGSTDLDVTVAQ
jgi:hypothetical protein